jgi:hypothetical protein
LELSGGRSMHLQSTSQYSFAKSGGDGSCVSRTVYSTSA